VQDPAALGNAVPDLDAAFDYRQTDMASLDDSALRRAIYVVGHAGFESASSSVSVKA
jgi:hypothetical protein